MKILSRLLVIVFTFAVVLIYNLTDTPTYEATLDKQLTNHVDFPIIMYHSFLKDTNSHGKFVISPQQFEDDVSYILEKGYTPIFVRDLIEYVNGNIELPDKPIMITIDDGYYNNYLYAYPILKKYNAKAVISPIVKYCELYSEHEENNAYYSHITWEQGKEMLDGGLIEFQNHTYNLHSISAERKGIKKLKNESKDEYEKFLYADLYKAHNLIKENFGYEPLAIAYPFGMYSNEANKVIEQLGYTVSFSSTEGINTISKDKSLHMLKRYNRPHGKSSKEFFKNILK